MRNFIKTYKIGIKCKNKQEFNEIYKFVCKNELLDFVSVLSECFLAFVFEDLQKSDYDLISKFLVKYK